MRISYDEFRFYIYDMLGSNKADIWGDLELHSSIIVQALLLEEKRQCWKVPSLRCISKYIQIVRSSCSVFQSFGYFANTPGALLFNGANNKMLCGWSYQ